MWYKLINSDTKQPLTDAQGLHIISHHSWLAATADWLQQVKDHLNTLVHWEKISETS